MASSEYQGCPPGVVRGSASQAATASSVNHTVRLPRWRKAASYSAQFVTRRRCLGIWWRRSALALNGIGDPGSPEGASSYASHPCTPTARSVQQTLLRWTMPVAILGVALREQLLEHRLVLVERWPLILLMGTLGLTVFNALMYVAAHHTSAVNITILQGSMPVLV